MKVIKKILLGVLLLSTTLVFSQGFTLGNRMLMGSVIPSEITVKYGYLYNWYVVDDARNIANTGWSVPTKVMQKTLSDFLGGNSVAGGELKETGTTYFDSPNTGATNSSNFNGRGSGERVNTTGIFEGLKLGTSYWAKESVGSGGAIGVLDYTTTIFEAYDGTSTFSKNKKYGGPIRLIKDTTTLSDGETGTYIGNDGKVYRTICIGTQEWVADNLVETKYRNSDAIPEVTDNATWIGLSTGARCSYDNDESNAL